MSLFCLFGLVVHRSSRIIIISRKVVDHFLIGFRGFVFVLFSLEGIKPIKEIQGTAILGFHLLSLDLEHQHELSTQRIVNGFPTGFGFLYQIVKAEGLSSRATNFF